MCSSVVYLIVITVLLSEVIFRRNIWLYHFLLSHSFPDFQIICKMASMLSRTTVEHMLLPRFCELCSDGKLFQVRKVGVCKNEFVHCCSNAFLHNLVITLTELSKHLEEKFWLIDMVLVSVVQ